MTAIVPPGGAAVARSADGSWAAFERLYELIARINGQRTLDETLQAIVGAVVEGLGFGVAVVNQVLPDGSFMIVAVAGPDSARRALLGMRRPAHAFDADLAAAEEWGGLRYVPHERLTEDSVQGWIPTAEDAPLLDGPDAWHPLDALFAPLLSSTGELVGMLSVDLPADGRLPGPLHRKLLEIFAVQAGAAIDNARLTARLQAEHQLLLRERELLAASEQSFRLAFDGAGVGMSIIGIVGADARRYLRVNSAMCQITGYPAEALVGKTFDEITHPDDREMSLAAYERGVSGAEPVFRGEKRFVRADGSTVWAAVTTSVVRLESGEPLYGICQIEDITEKRAAAEELARRASRDPLTGLLNRAELQARLGTVVERAGLHGAAGAVLFLDLDGFKAVNDTHGHALGDEVLVIAASRLADHLRSTDTIARLGGDEFVVYTPLTDPDELAQLATRLQQAVSMPMVARDVEVRLSASIGIAVVREDDADGVALLRRADTAMYRVKAEGGGGFAFARHEPAPSAAAIQTSG